MTRTITRGYQKKLLYRLAIARSDVAEAVFTSEEFRQRVRTDHDPLYKPLLHAAAIAYARPFVTSRAGNTISGKWGRFSNPDLQRTHDQLLGLRHRFVAHSDPTERTVLIVPPGLALHEGPREHFEKTGIAVRDIAYPPEWMKLVSATAEDLGMRLQAEVERLLDELYGTRALPNGMFPLTFDEDL